MIPENLKYTKQHEWVKIDNQTAIFGITDHAQSELGDITFIELPEIGSAYKQSDAFSTVESVKAASEIYAPLSATVKETNSELENSPELINQSPYERGWICKAEITSPNEISSLLSASEYKEYLGKI